jgi:hypothetical protein
VARLLLPALLASASVSLGQRNNELRPALLDPVQAVQQARALVAELLAQTPDRSITNTGHVRIRDANGDTRQIPLRSEIRLASNNWTSSYEIPPSAGSSAGVRVSIIHSSGQPNRYELSEPAPSGAVYPVARQLMANQIMMPFAGSDFWIADLGLEFLHWPKQRVLKQEMRHSTSCRVLESTNPHPVPGGYARVVSWIENERPHGIVHADAYDAKGELLKCFDPSKVVKLQGEYQLKEMEMRNAKTKAHTWIEFSPLAQ